MPIQRISTFSVHQATLNDVNKVQSSLFDLQNQLSSKNKTQTFAGLAGQTEHFVALEARIRKTDTYVQNNEVVLARLNTTKTVMDGAVDIMDDMENLLTLRRNTSNADTMNFEQQMVELRNNMAQALNTSFDGQYLFSGTRTNTPPIKMPVPDPINVGEPDAGYYQGSEEDITVRAQDSVEITYNVRASDPAFQKMFAAVSMAIDAHRGKNDDNLAKSLDLLQEAMKETVGIQTKVNSNIVSITRINERHGDLKLYWKGVTDQIITTDIVAVSTEVAVNQAVLQATFQTFARINQLKLSDYL